jgi:pyruvate,water dikinase
VAVRSSATCEDAADASFAGLQDTYLWVRGAQQTLQRVRSCWASLYSVESISYRLKHRFPEERVAMAVVVQIMVDARTAGVMFTRSPTTGDRSVVTIEGAWGLGSAVVGGEVTPDRWVLGKITGEITVREIADKLIQHVRSPPAVSSPRRSARSGGACPAMAIPNCSSCAPSRARSSVTTAARRTSVGDRP